MISKENERKFLVSKIPFNLDNYKSLNTKQYYISLNPEIRIRKKNDRYYWEIKGDGTLSRPTKKFNITKEDYKDFKLFKKSNTIIKIRYIIPIENDYEAEIDIYKDYLEGLITVEVEFNSIKEANNFIPPYWFDKEITFNNKYKNKNLAFYGLK
ncbi:MAG: adenylate cyclase [archaeon]